MAYTKTNWQTGDTITAEKLNHAEQGIADASGLTGEITWDEQTGDGTLTLTYSQIKNAILSAKEVFIIDYQEVDRIYRVTGILDAYEGANPNLVVIGSISVDTENWLSGGLMTLVFGEVDGVLCCPYRPTPVSPD